MGCQISSKNKMPSPKNRPNFCALLKHYNRRFVRMKMSPRENLGVAFLLLNMPVGWGGAAICSMIAAHNKAPWLHIVSGVIYALSWGMLFLGAYLAGPKVAKNTKSILPSGWKAYRRARK